MDEQGITILEYIWIGGRGEIRSKTRVLYNYVFRISDIPEWNYDGSSTKQAPQDGNTEVILKPVELYENSLFGNKKYNSYLILCDTYDVSGNPLPTNYRYNANKIFSSKTDEEPWFGLEQEYFFDFNRCGILRFDKLIDSYPFHHYCGIACCQLERKIAELHLEKCLEAGLEISGINSEVEKMQWEFQIGPSIGIAAADQLIIARYLLERIAESFDVSICYKPKLHPDFNGSGCHINFSTKSMRESGGLAIIESCMEKLEKNHQKHIDVYGKDNHLRLTGLHETSDINKFSYGIGTRNTSVRIPNQSVINKCGYFEDRRPASNIDPYQATSILFETCCINN
jgi:glutamine synthetase